MDTTGHIDTVSALDTTGTHVTATSLDTRGRSHIQIQWGDVSKISQNDKLGMELQQREIIIIVI